MVEEYVYPGGFTEFMKRFNPKFAPFISLPVVIAINGLQVLACISAIVVGRSSLAFSMSVASLLFINGLIHVGGCIRSKGYVPGVITGMFLYIPLSSFAYFYYLDSGEMALQSLFVSVVLGLFYQTFPPGYFMAGKALEKGAAG